MLRLSMDELESMKYVLMTDDGGDVYTNAVVSYMKKNIGYETVKNLYSQYSSLNENKSAGEYDDSKIDSALKALKDNAAHEGGGKSIARSSPPRAYSAPSSVSKAKQTSESKAESTEGGNAIENPLVKVQKVKASGILSQVVDESTVSGNSIDTSARVSGRSLHKGTGGWSESGDDWYAKVLMQQYILTYMSCYTDTNPNHALNYEVEYIIGGRASDKDNLKIVIAEILALRAAANMAYLAGSASKQAQAMALAAIIGGITLTPEEYASWNGWHKVKGKMKKAYRNGSFVMNQSTFDTGIDGMEDKNGQPIGRTNYGVNGEETYRFMGKNVETVEDDVLPSWDDANEGDVIAVFMNFSDYVINTNMEMQVVKWTDNDNNKIKNKCLMVVDGKVADAAGIILVKKGVTAV